MEVHTKTFYSGVERNIKYVLRPHKKSPRKLSCLLCLVSTSAGRRALIWTHIWRILPLVCKHGNFPPCDIEGGKVWWQVFDKSHQQDAERLCSELKRQQMSTRGELRSTQCLWESMWSWLQLRCCLAASVSLSTIIYSLCSPGSFPVYK